MTYIKVGDRVSYLLVPLRINALRLGWQLALGDLLGVGHDVHFDVRISPTLAWHTEFSAFQHVDNKCSIVEIIATHRRE